jgi:hypothetical protein
MLQLHAQQAHALVLDQPTVLPLTAAFNFQTLQVGHFPFTLVELIDSGAYDEELAGLEVSFNAVMDDIYGTA